MKKGTLLLFILLGLYVLQGCNIARHLPAGEKLYDGTDIKVEADSTVSKKEREQIESRLSELARPKPNKKLFGFPYKVGLYYFIGEPKKDSGFRAWARRKFGEQPVLASARALSSNAALWTAFLENEGYFRSAVTGDLVEEGYKARGVYQVQVPQRYLIDSVTYLTDSTPLQPAMKAIEKRSLLKKDNPYRFEVIKLERERIADALRRQGYFYFQPDYLAILADSVVGNHRTRLYIAVKPETPRAALLPYSIRDLYIYPNYSLTGNVGDTALNRSYQFEDFRIVDPAGLFNPKLFREVVAVQPGRRYSSRAQDLTLSRFINVGSFKFVRSRFEPDQEGDSAVLDVHYYLTPYPKKSVRLEIAGTSRSNNLVGSQLTVSWRNRNALGRSELLSINANAGIEFQVGARGQGVTNYRYGIQGSLTFPRLVSPIPIRYYRRSQVLPKTTVTLGYDLIVRGDYYNLNSFLTTFGYTWRSRQRSEHIFQPFNINYVRPSNYGEKFFLLEEDPTTRQQYINIYRSEQLILSSLYTYNLSSSPRTVSRYTYRLTFNAEPAGNLAAMMVNKRNELGKEVIFGVPYSQYVRFDLDSRHFLRVAPSLTWANRIFAGVGIPYGNSNQLPFVKQYFVGGANSLRAFRPRAVGPGVYTRNTDGIVQLQDGGGDIKLEANTEFRPRINQYLQGALFLDVGNVWMYSDESTYGFGTTFRKDFYKQLAVGTGVGLRLDLSYFVVRFDLAFPLRKPWLPEGARWVADEIALGNRAWRRDNLILNVAVGYPF
ncbi:translocation and assembly module lipoprotein TamL [Larkinella soli]|uniref:translocation and assembly module lipoprotein TamL n=1 Tax=Larkinella soli TaxID=1770527 RepID=UPI000FFC2DE8|nr:BamA/TamA family outer membrane protein [Larkinella soli]